MLWIHPNIKSVSVSKPIVSMHGFFAYHCPFRLPLLTDCALIIPYTNKYF